MTYSFLTLSHEEKVERRRQLNLSGMMAWLSPIVLLLVVYVHRTLLRPLLGQIVPPQTLARWRRVSWVLGTKTFYGGHEFGPLGVVLSGVCYGLWLMVLVFRATGSDYMHLAKAFGHVAVSQLPLIYLLGVKTAWSPITLATGWTHERLNVWHRLLGRMAHGLASVHVAMYVNFFVRQQVLWKRGRDRDVILGLVAFSAFSFLWLSSLPVVRKRWYHFVFYRSHAVLSAVLVPAMWWHVPYTRFYVGQAGLLWAAGALVRRWGSSAVVRARCVAVDGTELVDVVLEVPTSSRFVPGAPGQHLYVHNGWGPRTPFTIAEVKKEKGLVTVRLIVRNVGGPQTRWIADMAKNSTKATEVRVEGPYGDPGLRMPDMIRRRQKGPVLMVAGGVGATYIIPIYITLVNQRRSTAGEDAKVRLVWVVRRLADAAWGIDMLKGVGVGLEECGVDIYVTRGSVVGDGDMEEQWQPELSKDGVRVHKLGRRPDLTPLIDGFFATTSSESAGTGTPPSDSRLYDARKLRKRQIAMEETTAYVCGPGSLATDVREAVGRHVMVESRKVRWVEEVFGFGGT